jgi:putative NADH-flavin reductase
MIAAMRKQGTRRLVILTDTGVEDPSDRPTLIHKILRIAFPRVNEKLARDSTAAAQVTADSGVEWTLVRSPILTDGPRTNNYKVGPLARGMPLRVSRADVAEFMLSCVVDGRFIRERPVIGGGRPRSAFWQDARSNL